MNSQKDTRRDGLLATELAFFEKHREEFALKYAGRYLLVYGDALVGHFDTLEAAIDEGVRRFGAGPFLARGAGQDAPILSVPALTLGVPLVAGPQLQAQR